MLKKRIICQLLIVLLLLTLLSGCTPKTAPSQSPNEGTTEGVGVLKEATTSKIGSLNPHTYTSSYQSSVISRTQARLFAYLPNDDYTSYALKGELADGVPEMIDNNGKVWKIKIKSGVCWENGDTLDAEDVVYTYKALLDPVLLHARGGSFAKDYITIKNAEQYYLQEGEEGNISTWDQVGIKMIDNLTLEITTEDQQSVEEVMNHFAHPATALVYDKLYEELMNADRTETLYGTDKDKYMTSGKFVLEDWIPDALVVYKRNPNYVYKDDIKLAGIETKVVENAGTQMQIFKNGEIDYVNLSSEDFIEYEQDPRVLFSPANSITSITFNTINPDKPILANLNFRKAISYAIDRKSIADITKETPANYIVSTRQVIEPVTGLRYRDTEMAKANVSADYGYNAELAKQFFDKALQEEGLEKVELSMIYSDSERYKLMTEFIQKQLPTIFGEDRFALEVQAMPSNQLNTLKKTWKQDPKAYEITWSGWSGNELAPWNAMKYWTGSYSRKNEPFFNDDFDKLWGEANSGENRFEEGKRLEYTAQMEKIILEEIPFVPVVEGISKCLKSDRVELAFPKWINKIGFGWEYASIKE